MKKILTILALLSVFLLVGCSQELIEEKEYKVAGDEDKKTTVTVKDDDTSVKTQDVDQRIVDVLANQEDLKGYSYKIEHYESVDSNRVLRWTKFAKKGDKIRQEYSGRIFFREGDGEVYEFFPGGKNKTKRVLANVLREDTLLLNVDEMINPEVINFNWNRPLEGMLIGYEDSAGNKYETYLWKHYGLPLEITKTKLNGDVEFVKYVDIDASIKEVEVTLPNAELIE